MAAQALYRKWRSQTFDELVGQEHVVQTLRNAIAEERVAHAYLFTGPRGVGKTTMARLLAKAVNCLAEHARRPCGQCAACTAIADGSAVDVIEMDAASHTSVEDARELIERVQFRPTSLRSKIYIIDEVHMLSTAAFNALLKTLEEPPDHAIFVLATTEVHKVPATILSRCQRFTFNRHTRPATAAHLRRVAAEEGFVLEAGVPEAIARASTGSLRDAISMLDQLFAFGGGQVTLAQVQGLLGASTHAEVVALVDALLAGDMPGALRAVNAVAGQGADLRQFARDLVEHLRALLLVRAGSGDLLDRSDDELAAIQAQAGAVETAVLHSWVRLFSALDHQLRTSPYGQLPLELAVVEALLPTPAAQPAATPRQPAARPAGAPAPRPTAPPARSVEPVARPEPAARSAEPPPGQPEPATPRSPAPPARSAPVPAPEEPVAHPRAQAGQHPAPAVPPAAVPPAPAEASEPPVVDREPELAAAQGGEPVEVANAAVAVLEQIESVWPNVVRDVRIYDKSLQALLLSGVRPSDVEDTIVILEVDNSFLMRGLERVQYRQIIEKVLSKQMGAAYGVRCVMKPQQRENSTGLREQIRESRKDPLVRAAQNIFDADIVGVEHDDPPL